MLTTSTAFALSIMTSPMPLDSQSNTEIFVSAPGIEITHNTEEAVRDVMSYGTVPTSTITYKIDPDGSLNECFKSGIMNNETVYPKDCHGQGGFQFDDETELFTKIEGNIKTTCSSQKGNLGFFEESCRTQYVKPITPGNSTQG